MKELLLSFLFALVVGSMINSCSQSMPGSESPPGGQQQATAGQSSAGGQSSESGSQGGMPVIEASEATFDAEVMKSNHPVLVEFGAKWCQPCKLMAPILDEVANQYSGKLKVVRIDVDENRTLSEQYAQGGLPTFVIFQGGKTRKMFVGFTAKSALLKELSPFVS